MLGCATIGNVRAAKRYRIRRRHFSRRRERRRYPQLAGWGGLEPQKLGHECKPIRSRLRKRVVGRRRTAYGAYSPLKATLITSADGVVWTTNPWAGLADYAWLQSVMSGN